MRDRIEGLRAAFEKVATARRDANYPRLAGNPLAVTVTFGPRYARIIREGSAAGFVDLTTGDILYASSWKGAQGPPPAWQRSGRGLRLERLRRLRRRHLEVVMSNPISEPTRTELVDLYGTEIVERYERGAYRFSPPPVITVGWSTKAWFAYIFGPPER